MAITAKVRNKQIDTGKVLHALVQGEHASGNITFQIIGEEELVEDFNSTYFYLLYTRPSDTRPNVLLLTNKQLQDDVISVTFKPTSYFTAEDGTVQIQIMATDTEGLSIDSETGTISGSVIWQTFPGAMFVHASQLTGTETIIEENVLTQYLAGMQELYSQTEDAEGDAADYAQLAKDWASKTNGAVEGGEMSAKYYAGTADSRAKEAEGYAVGTVSGSPSASFAGKNAKELASDAQDWAKGTRSDGKTPSHTSDNAKAYAESAAGSAAIVYAHAEAIDAIGDDLTNIDAVAADILDDDSAIDAVAANITNVNAVAANETNINAVNTNKTNINTVAGKATEITTVAGIASDVSAVAAIASDVAAVEDIDDDVSAVAAIAVDVGVVADAATDVAAVADGITDVGTVATNISDVGAVASDITKIAAVADDLTNIDAVADDLANIDAADEHALEAEGWANGTQNGTPVSSGSPYYENNAKYWADAVPNLNNALTAIDHRVENLEQAKGSYVVQNYKDGSITPSGKGKWCVVEGVEGVSRVENNLSDIADGSSGTVNTIGTHFTTFQYNHFYLFALRATFPSQPTSGGGSASPSTPIYLGFWNNALTSFQRHPFAYQSSGNYAFVGSGASLDGNLTDGSSAKVVLQTFPNTGELCTFADVLITDLNVYFGTSDLSFLGATDSAKLATIQKDYPHLLLPSDYGVRIVDSSYSGVRAWARNLWDEVVRNGYYDATTGEFFPYSGYVANTNPIAVVPSLSYYVGTNIAAPFFYDADMNYLGQVSATNGVVVAPANARYMNFRSTSNYGGTYHHDICINQSDSQNGTYTPYHAPSTLSLSFQGKSAGSVYDSCEPNVEVNGVAKKRTTERIVSTALDNKTWIRRNDGLFYTSTPVFSDAKDSSSNVLCDKFLPCPSGQTGTSTPEGCISVGSGGYIYAMKAGIADTTAFLAYVADSVLYSEAKTESVTLSDPLIDNTLLTESGGRMATVQTGTVVDGSFDMGFITL